MSYVHSPCVFYEVAIHLKYVSCYCKGGQPVRNQEPHFYCRLAKLQKNVEATSLPLFPLERAKKTIENALFFFYKQN